MSKATKKNASKNVLTQEQLNIFKLLLLIVTLFVSFYSPYVRGLFFEPEQFVAQIILLSIFIMYWIYKWLKNDRSFVKTPIDYAALGLVFAYFISSFTAVSQRLAVSEFLKYAMYFVVFLILSDIVNSEKEKKIVLWTIISSALGVCIVGIDSVAGGKIVEVLNSLFKAIHLNVNFFGLFVEGRIHSTMQYPNALASYLLAVFFLVMGLTITSEKWAKAVASSVSFVLLTTFVFTLSRGTYILLILAIPLFLLLLPKGCKLKGIYSIVTVGIVTGVFSFLLSNFISGTFSNKVFIWGLILSGALISFFIRFTDDFVIKVFSKINVKFAIVSSTVISALFAIVFVSVLNTTAPLQLGHAQNGKDGYVERDILVRLSSNKNYKLVFKVDGKSENKNAQFVYRIYMETANERSIATGNKVAIADKQYNITKGIEEKEIEFTMPENAKMVGISFQNYYSGTNVVFYNAKIVEADSGKLIKNLKLKYKYKFAEVIFSRFENLTRDKSLNTRMLFINDGFKIFKDWWLLGAGGGAWRLLNFKYQSNLYWSTQTHNYPLQVLIESGVIGFAFLVLLFISIVISFIKLHRKKDNGKINENIMSVAIFTAIVFLFLHSIIDFDFSLSSIYLLVWQLIALINTDARKHLIQRQSDIERNKNNTNAITKNPIEGLKNKLQKGFCCYPIVVIIISIIVLILPIRLLTAYTYAKDALKCVERNNLDEAMQIMEKAIELDYLNTEYIIGYVPIASKPDFKLGYIDLLISKLESVSTNSDENNDKAILNNYIIKAQKLVKKAEKHAKNNADLCMNIGAYYLRTSEKEKGFEYITKSAELKPLVPLQWKNKAKTSYALATNYFQQGDDKKGLDYIDKTLGIIEEVKEVNKNNLSPFTFDEEMQGYLEKAYYLKSEYNNNQVNLEKLIFQSVFEMDVDNNNIPDQWFINNKPILDTNLDDGIFRVNSKDLNKDSYIYTRNLSFELNSSYRIDVEVLNSNGIESIPYMITGISGIEQLNHIDNIYSARFTPTGISEDNCLVIYIKGDYEIKNVRIVKE